MEYVTLNNNRGSISRCGIYRNKNGRILKGCIRHGYRMVYTGERQERLHRLVAEAYIANDFGLPEVNHRDGNKLNNHALNLEWCTRLQNMRHAADNNLLVLPHGENSRAAKLNQDDIDFIRTSYVPRSPDRNLTKLSDMFGVTPQCIFRIVKKQTWAA